MSFIYYDNNKKRNVFSYSLRTPNGVKRKRKFFKTKKAAIECKKTHDANQIVYGKIANFDLDKYQKFLMIEEYADGIDLIKAVDHYKATYRVARDRVLASTIKPYIKYKKSLNVSPEWIITIRGYLKKIEHAMGKKRMDKINTQDLLNFISELPYSISYKDNIRRLFQNYFKHAVKVGWCKINPAEDLEPYIDDDRKIEFVVVHDVVRLFEYLETNNKKLIPFNVIRAFTGMRTSHVMRLSWNNINFKEKGIKVYKKGKSNHDFLQGFPENLWIWLEKYKKYSINYSKVEREAGFIIKQLGIRYPHNGFRHAFGTYHVSLFKDTALTSYLIQHTNQRTLYKHYKGNATESEGNKYFSILPKT